MNKTILLSLYTVALFADMSIQEAWKYTSANNNSLKAGSADVSRAELKRESIKSMYLPSVSLTGSYTHLSEPIGIEGEIDLHNLPLPIAYSQSFRIDLSEQDIFLADLNLLWPLYTGGRIDAAQDIYAAQVSESKALASMKKDVSFLKLVKYYYGVVVADSLLKTRIEGQKALELHYINALKLKEQGQIAKIELLNAEVKLDAARIETRESLHKLEIASSALSSITKQTLKPHSHLFVNEEIQEESYYKEQTKNNYAGLKVLDAKERQSASVINLKKAAWHPEVAAYGSYNLYRDDSPLMSTIPTWFAGVMVKIDLIKRRDRSQEVQAAELLNSKVKYLKYQAIDDLSLLVEKTYKEMLAADEKFHALNSSVRLSQENYKLQRIAFKEGLSTSVDLVDAQMFLQGTKTKRLNAAYEFVQKLSQLSVLSGDREMFFDIAKNSEEIQ